MLEEALGNNNDISRLQGYILALIPTLDDVIQIEIDGLLSTVDYADNLNPPGRGDSRQASRHGDSLGGGDSLAQYLNLARLLHLSKDEDRISLRDVDGIFVPEFEVEGMISPDK